MSTIKKYIPYIFLTVLILFNFFLYRGEFKVLSDPNDNTFHYALIDDAKQVWKEVFKGRIKMNIRFDGMDLIYSQYVAKKLAEKTAKSGEPQE